MKMSVPIVTMLSRGGVMIPATACGGRSYPGFGRRHRDPLVPRRRRLTSRRNMLQSELFDLL